MSYFNYHISKHLLRPATITDPLAITYTPNGTTSPDALTPNVAETSKIVSPFNGDSVNTNFYNLAVATTDLTFRVSTLETYSNNSESPNFGFVNYNGRQEVDGNFYGANPFVLQGATSFVFPYVMDTTSKKAFKIAANEGIVYTSNTVDTTNSRFRAIIWGEAANGSPFSSTAAMLTYMNSKLKYNSNDATNTFQFVGSIATTIIGGFDTISGGSPRSVYVFWNDGIIPYRNSQTYNDGTGSVIFIRKLSNSAIVGAKLTFTSALASIGAVNSALNNALNVTIGNSNTFTVTTIGGTSLNLSISNDRTKNGIYQLTFHKDSGDVGNGILEWLGWNANGTLASNPDPVGSYPNLQTGDSEAYDYSSLFQFTASGTGPYYLALTGQGAYYPMSLVDGYTATTGLLGAFGMSAATTTYYHTRRPSTSYVKNLNYGGDFWASTLNSTGDTTVQGNLTVLGTISSTVSNTAFVLPSYVANSNFELNTINLTTPPNWIPYANVSASAAPTSGGLGTIVTFTVTPGGGATTGTIYVNGIQYTITSTVADTIATQISQIVQPGYAFAYVTTGQVSIAVTSAYPTPTIVLGSATNITFPSVSTYGTPSSLVTLLSNTTNPLFGSFDVIMSKDAANRQGQGFSVPFTTERGAVGQPFQVSLYYQTSTNYASGDIGVYIYDVTNASLIPLSVSSLPASSQASLFTASFYPSTSINYRLILHIASVNASAYSLEFDNVSVNPQNPYLTQTTMVSNPMAYVPTVVGAGTIIPGYCNYSRRGNRAFVNFRFTSGTTAATLATFSLPPGLTASVPDANAAVIGVSWRGNVDATTVKNYVIRTTDGSTTVDFSNDDYTGTTSPLGTGLNGSTLWGTGEVVEGSFEVDISQWSVQTNLITDFTEYASNTDIATGDQPSSVYFYNGKEGSTIPSVTALSKKRVQFSRPIQITDKLELEVYNTLVGQWFPVYQNPSGSLSATVQGTSSFGMWLTSVTGSTTQLDVSFAAKSRPINTVYGVNTDAEAWATVAASTTNKWRVRKIANGNTAEYPVLIRAEYTETSATAIEGSAARLNFNVKVEDTNNAVTTGASTWAFIAPVAGEYRIILFGETASSTPSSGDSLTFDVYLNGTQHRRLGKYLSYGVVAAPTDFNYTTSIRMNTGDNFYIWLTKVGYATDWSTSTGAGPLLPRIIITRVGS
jgi:hypothetical protein